MCPQTVACLLILPARSNISKASPIFSLWLRFGFYQPQREMSGPLVYQSFYSENSWVECWGGSQNFWSETQNNVLKKHQNASWSQGWIMYLSVILCLLVVVSCFYVVSLCVFVVVLLNLMVFLCLLLFLCGTFLSLSSHCVALLSFCLTF